MPILHAPTGFKRFTVELIVAAILFTALTYTAIYVRTRSLLYDSLRLQAENHFDLVVTARAWNSEHDGVWVVMGPGVEPNPYLEDLGVDAVVETTDGRQMTLRNPAIMASEISQLLEAKLGVTYHLVALEAINPANMPDEWERESLLAFQKNSEPLTTIAVGEDGKRSFRYMERLTVTSSCIGCHEAQHYELGQVAGATTVEIPLAAIDDQLRANAITLTVLGVLSAIAATASILLMTSRLGKRVRQANERLAEVAVTDELTEVLNRRGALARLSEELARAERTDKPLAVAMLDLDHFKSVNDRFGHLVGDEALRHVANVLRAESRAYDVLGRLGGEEFLIVAPDTAIESMIRIAERIRERVSVQAIDVDGRHIDLTVSIGVVQAERGESLDRVLSRADEAMYAAKDAGRNRVVRG